MAHSLHTIFLSDAHPNLRYHKISFDHKHILRCHIVLQFDRYLFGIIVVRCAKLLNDLIIEINGMGQ